MDKTVPLKFFNLVYSNDGLLVIESIELDAMIDYKIPRQVHLASGCASFIT